MSSVDELLKSIITAVESSSQSVDSIVEKVRDEVTPEIVNALMQTSSVKKPEGMSLLSLKNGSLLAYLNSIVLILLTRLELLDGDDDEEGVRSKAIKSSIVQRVTLEKGVKPLEKKLSYQVDKMVRAFTRMENEEQEIKQKKNGSGSDSDSGSGSLSDDDNDDDDDEDDDALAYRPDASALSKLIPTSKDRRSVKSKNGESQDSAEKYKPPKISAMAPPTQKVYDEDSGPKARSGKKLQSMEEYLRESSDLPQVEHSVGSQIVDHGRGGVKTQHERQKEKEIQEYEEANFTRLPQSKTKKNYKQKRADMMNNFAGENWSMFNNSRDLSEGTSRKRKAGSAWDRAKKRR
ncbi:uncharacterized protein KQ657_001344 [Scheffersomyces spartinae]|uniref:Uncharacterized protein n=1 Tax=Scheffersomyces spartinae TaxID=45513 RepID=A0A9P7V827_9ASCO|nr:uncharacterized protein KQ657_001344 [Scheffersomyces spartinae]KAG7192887.1 hypothetical protein KQ657_001344 [Scheffersomyces spartinae]